jgi:hypothetical protein
MQVKGFILRAEILEKHKEVGRPFVHFSFFGASQRFLSSGQFIFKSKMRCNVSHKATLIHGFHTFGN